MFGWFFFHSDMYALAECLLHNEAGLHNKIAERFSYVLLDEMQDTNLIQDRLLQTIFENTIVQRFGDPDQAIFGEGLGESNKSFNEKSGDEFDFILNDSHRFGTAISSICKSMSYNQINLTATTTPPDENANTIFLFHKEKILDVIPAFLKLAEGYSNNIRRLNTVKIVGGIGNQVDKDSDLKIGSYYSEYNNEQRCSDIRLSSFYEFIYKIHLTHHEHSFTYWDGVIYCIVRWLCGAGIKDSSARYYTKKSLIDLLKLQGKYEEFRKVVSTFYLSPDILKNKRMWDEGIALLKASVSGVSWSKGDNSFWDYGESSCCCVVSIDEAEATCEESVLAGYSFLPELKTIHKVKGETHDATLLLETKFQCLDVNNIFEYLKRSDSTSVEAPTGELAPKFMRQAYVAMTRPRHLLCIAISDDGYRRKGWDKAVYDDDALTLLKNKGWNIVNLQ